VADAFLRVGKRFFYTPADDLYVYFEVFRATSTIVRRNVVEAAPEAVRASVFLHRELRLHVSFPTASNRHANAAFLSNLHADFGWWASRSARSSPA
jgi:hypothetical protein